MAVRWDRRGHQSAGRQALCEGRGHILRMRRTPGSGQPWAGGVCTRDLQGTAGAPPHPSLAVSSPPPPVATCSAWAPSQGSGSPSLFGDVSWQFRRAATHHAMSFLQAGPPHSGGGRGMPWELGLHLAPRSPRGPRCRSTQCSVLETALPRRHPSVGTVALSSESVFVGSQSQVYVFPLPAGQVEGGQCCHLLANAWPRVGARVGQAGPSWSWLLRRRRPVAELPWFQPPSLGSGSAGAGRRAVVGLRGTQHYEATTRDRAEGGAEVTPGGTPPSDSGRDSGTGPGGSREQWPVRA